MTETMHWAQEAQSSRGATKSGRIAAIEWAKILFALSIVCLHTGIFTDLSRPLNILIGNNLARLGVPFFLFVTGFYFARQVERGIGHLLRRMAGLYAVWTLAYLPFWIGGASLPLFVTNIIVGYWQLWYLLAALISAVMLYLVRGLSSKALIGLAVAILALGAALQYGQRVDQSPVHESLPISADGALARNFLFFAFPFMALGYVASRMQSRWDGLGRSTRHILLGVTGAIFAAEIGMNDLVFNAVGPFDIFLSSALFIPVLFLTLKGQGGGWQISPAWSTGIYLVHVLWINVLGMALPDLPRLALGSAVIALSLASVPVLRQINRHLPVL